MRKLHLHGIVNTFSIIHQHFDHHTEIIFRFRFRDYLQVFPHILIVIKHLCVHPSEDDLCVVIKTLVNNIFPESVSYSGCCSFLSICMPVPSHSLLSVCMHMPIVVLWVESITIKKIIALIQEVALN